MIAAISRFIDIVLGHNVYVERESKNAHPTDEELAWAHQETEALKRRAQLLQAFSDENVENEPRHRRG